MFMSVMVFSSMAWAVDSRHGRPLSAFHMIDYDIKKEIIKPEAEVPVRHNIQVESIQDSIMKQASEEVCKGNLLFLVGTTFQY